MISWLMQRLARLPIGYPKVVIGVSIALTLAAVFFVPRLHISTDRNLLSGTDNAAFARREEVNRLFGTTLGLVVILRGDDQEEVHRTADELATELSKHDRHVRDVFYKADIGFFEQHALMFASKSGLADMVQTVNGSGMDFGLVASADGLAELIELGTEQLEEQPVPEDANPKDVDKAFGFFGEVIDDVRAWFEQPERTDLAVLERMWQAGPSMAGNVSREGYLTEGDGKQPHLTVLFVQPVSDSQAMEVVEPFTDLVRDRVGEVTGARPGIDSLVTGMPAIATDELRLVRRDCLVAGVAAGLGVLLVFIIAFRSLRVSLFLVLPLGVGLLWSAGFTGAVYGHLTLITGYFAAVLFGLGVAFTIHIVSRFHEALRAGKDKAAAVELAVIKAGPGTVVGGGTTVLAFLAIAFSEFQGFAEMGVISGVGVLLILVANLTLLPAALLLWHPGLEGIANRPPAGAFWVGLARSRVVVPVIAAAGLIAGAVLASKVGFDYAVESMLPQKSEAVKGIKLLDARTDFSTTYSVAVASTPTEAEQLRRRFEELETVSRAEAISMFVPTGQQGKIDVLAGVDPGIRADILAAATHVKGLLDKEELGTSAELAAAFEGLGDTLEDLSFDAKRAGRREAGPLKDLAKRAAAASKAIVASGKDERAQELERMILDYVRRGLKIVADGLTDRGFGIDDLPATIRGRYVSRDGESFAVIAFPSGDIGQRDFFYPHVDELKSVDPNVTGHPVTHKLFTEMVHEGFIQAVILAAIAVLAMILLDLRHPRSLALALAPVVVGAGWTALILYLTGIKMNYGNLMGLPILIGTGVDYGVHLAHRARQEGSVLAAARTTGKAIALSGATTLIGFGSLILGNHWGVRSLGIVLVLGILASLLAALVVLPGMVKRKGVTANGGAPETEKGENQ